MREDGAMGAPGELSEQDVAELEVFDWGLISLGFDGGPEGPGDAVITCVDLR